MSPTSVKQLDLILFLLVLLIAISDCTQRIKRMYAMCPPKFIKIGNECYYVSTERLNWLESHFACKDKNSKLAEPIKMEDRALRKYMLHNDTDKIEKWIGGVYNWERNKWQWGQTGRTVIYQSFSQMDPRSRQDLKYHCAVLNPALKYRWSAKICVEKYQYICQHRMPYVDEINKQKVYDRWNETFPNEKANEVEMFMDQPANNNTRKIKEKRQRIEQRMIRKPLQLNVTHEVYRHVDVEQLLHENSIRPTTPRSIRPTRKGEKRRRRTKRRRTTAKPISTTPTPDVLNDAAIGNGRISIPFVDHGGPIVESVFYDDYIVKRNKTMMQPQPPTRPSVKPIKRRRNQKRRRPLTDKQRHKNRQENETTNNRHVPRHQDNETTNSRYAPRQEKESNVTTSSHHPPRQEEKESINIVQPSLNDVTEKLQFDDIEKTQTYHDKLRREKEAARMAEAKRQLEQNHQKQEEKKRIEEEHRTYLEKQLEKERELKREREAYEKQMREYREEEERRHGEEKLRLKELEILERERLEEEQQRAEQKIREKNEREESRRLEELRLRDEAEAKRLEEQRQRDEVERKMEEERLAEDQRLMAEQKRREQERAEADELKRKEEEKLHKIEEQKQRKRQELLERFKKLSPEQRQEYLKRRRQMKNESTIPE